MSEIYLPIEEEKMVIIVLLLTFVCLGSFSEFWKKLRIFNQKRRQNVGPMTINTGRAQSIAVKPHILYKN